MIDLVVSRYHEDLRWVETLPPQIKVFVYNKGSRIVPFERPNTYLATLPNVGREAHTYLFHMLNHALPAAPYHTLYCQGNPFEHDPEFNTKLNLLSLSCDGLPSWISFGHHCVCDGNGMPQHKLPIAESYRQLTHTHNSPPAFKFVVGAQFAIKLTHRREHWLQLAFEMVRHDRGATIGGNNEGLSWGAHIMERLWSYLLIEAEPQ